MKEIKKLNWTSSQLFESSAVKYESFLTVGEGKEITFHYFRDNGPNPIEVKLFIEVTLKRPMLPQQTVIIKEFSIRDNEKEAREYAENNAVGLVNYFYSFLKVHPKGLRKVLFWKSEKDLEDKNKAEIGYFHQFWPGNTDLFAVIEEDDGHVGYCPVNFIQFIS